MKKRDRTLAIGGCIVVAVVLMSVFALSKTGKQSSNSAGDFSAEDKANPVSINAFMLFIEYRENEAAANEKYRGKWLKVSGSVLDVIETKDGYQVRYVGGNSRETYPATIALFPHSAQKELANLPLYILGKCAGRRPSSGEPYGFSVYLERCECIRTK